MLLCFIFEIYPALLLEDKQERIRFVLSFLISKSYYYKNLANVRVLINENICNNTKLCNDNKVFLNNCLIRIETNIQKITSITIGKNRMKCFIEWSLF